MHNDIPERPQTPAEHHSARSNDLDILTSIPNMYRLLDLVLEQGSGGLGMQRQNYMLVTVTNPYISVDKIIIDQESLGRLMNRLCPGVYVSVTKIDFKALDSVNDRLIPLHRPYLTQSLPQRKLKLIGAYGSKSALAKFFKDIAIVDDNMYAHLGVFTLEDAGPNPHSSTALPFS